MGDGDKIVENSYSKTSNGSNPPVPKELPSPVVIQGSSVGAISGSMIRRNTVPSMGLDTGN